MLVYEVGIDNTLPPNNDVVNSDVASKQSVIDFCEIRRICEANDDTSHIDLRPEVFRNHRISFWPSANTHGLGGSLSAIYESVKNTGVPNCLDARIQFPTNLNMEAWERELSGPGGNAQLLDFIRYGLLWSR